ncbi:MAG: PAS domain S-box protein [Thermoguttaceae bacterium]|jgi:PAS domain S-box-containing protein
MRDQDKTKEQLIAELGELRRRAADIGDRGRPEAALQESEERFRKLFDEGPIGILLVGTDGRIQRANRRFCEMLGYSEGEIVAAGLAGISHPDDWERDLPFVSRLWRGEISCYHVEKRYLRKDGQVLRGQLTVSLMHDGAGRPTNTVGMVEDITERKQAEERLQESERLLRALIDASPESVFLLDADETILLANETSAHRLGMTIDKMIGKKPRDIVSPKVANERTRHFDEVVRTGKAVRFEDKRSGRYYQNAMHPILDEQGKVVAVAVLAIDQTEQKGAEQALQKARDQLERQVNERTVELTRANDELAIFRKFAEASGEGVGMSDFDGRIVYANRSMCRLFGEEEPKDVVGKNVSAYYPEKYVQRRKDEMIPALLREGHWHAEQTVLPRRGQAIQTWQSTFLIRDENGNPLRIAVVIGDITARKQAEEALRASEEKYRGVAEACPDAIVMSDLDGRVLFASRQTWRLLGLADSDELVGRSVFDFVIESDRGRLAANLAHLVQAGVRRNTEYAALRKDGTTVPNETCSAVIRDASGRPKAVMAVIRDITERNRAEEALRRERRTLEHLLQASDHERRLIAYDIHDGLAQQLAGAIMQFQIYEYQKDGQPQDARKAYDGGMSLLRESHCEARRLISGVRPPILDESGVMAAIAHLVHDPVFDRGPKIDFRNRVTFHRLAPVLENVIYRIVQEGLTNARNHSNADKILVSLVQRDGRLWIAIRDWGIGFDPKTAQETSFGLKGIRERARLLGGKCRIKSKPGEGTSIVVELPVVEQESEQ